MTFTDDDLKRLKGAILAILKEDGRTSIYLQMIQVTSLLARLEAAELGVASLQAIGALPEGYCFCPSDRDANSSHNKNHVGECFDARKAIQAWRKSAGKP